MNVEIIRNKLEEIWQRNATPRVICNEITHPYRNEEGSVHPTFYVEGVGQHCQRCYEKAYNATECGCCGDITPLDNEWKWGNVQLCKNCFIYAFGESIEETHGHDNLARFE